MKIISALLLFIVCVSTSEAQQFRYEAKVDAVDSDGFYKIELNPDIISMLNESHSDLRIVDNEQNQIPYIWPSVSACGMNPFYVPYEIVERKIIRDSISYIIIHNKNRTEISSLDLEITNAEVVKQFRISGCNSYSEKGKTNWFVVKDAVSLKDFNSYNSVSNLKYIDFPKSNYEYYKIEMNDRQNEPLNIVRCVYPEWIQESEAFLPVEPKSIVYSDSAQSKTTWIKFFFEKPYEISQVIYYVKSPKYFHRTIALHGSKNRSYQVNAWPIKTGDSILYLNNHKIDSSYFSIANDDNPPLVFSSLKFYWKKTFIVSYLEKSKSYSLVFGNDSMQTPSYDLKYFEKLIPHQLTTLKIGEIHEIKNHVAAPKKKPYTFFTTKNFIWIAIAFIIVLLGTVTFKMLKEK